MLGEGRREGAVRFDIGNLRSRAQLEFSKGRFLDRRSGWKYSVGEEMVAVDRNWRVVRAG